MRLWIIVNPNAGRGWGARLLSDLRGAMMATGHEAQWHMSGSREDLVHLARSGVEQRVDAVVACGGDGTVHHILQGLLPSTVALGIIPTGRGNDLALSLGIPADYRQACDILTRGNIRLIDVARAGQRVYASVAGAGFDSEVSRRASRDATWLRGQAVYLNAVLRTLPRFKAKYVEIEYDDCRFVGEAMFVAVGNTTSYGGGVKIVPQARPDDGWLDVCIVKKTGKLDLLRNLPLAYRGEHARHPAVEMCRARRVTISSPVRMELFGDGEYLQDIPVTIDVLPQTLRVIVP